jgi:hypothetical protein
MRACARLNCGSAPRATIALRYGDREVLVRELVPVRDPNLLDLCDEHLARLTPPIGWHISDARTPATRVSG